MPVLDIDLRMRASVEVEASQVQTVRERIQAALDELVGAMEDYGVTFDPDQTWIARVRAEEGSK